MCFVCIKLVLLDSAQARSRRRNIPAEQASIMFYPAIELIRHSLPLTTGEIISTRSVGAESQRDRLGCQGATWRGAVGGQGGESRESTSQDP